MGVIVRWVPYRIPLNYINILHIWHLPTLKYHQYGSNVIVIDIARYIADEKTKQSDKQVFYYRMILSRLEDKTIWKEFPITVWYSTGTYLANWKTKQSYRQVQYYYIRYGYGYSKFGSTVPTFLQYCIKINNKHFSWPSSRYVLTLPIVQVWG